MFAYKKKKSLCAHRKKESLSVYIQTASWLARRLTGWQARAHFCHPSLLILRFSKTSIKILNISKDVKQKWNIVENDESTDVPKSVLFHRKYNNYENDTISSNPWTLQYLSISVGNMKILKISRSNPKSRTPRMLIITDVFEEKTMLRLQDKNQGLQECL